VRGARRFHPPCARARGFTIVELIAVLLLLGILAATATSRMVGGNAYAPALISQQLIALGRFAQQTAMSRQDVSVSLDVDQNAGDWRFRVQVNDGANSLTAREERADIANTSIAVANGAMTLPLSAAAPLRLAFDGLGNLSAASVAATTLVPGLGVGVRTNGDSASSVCIGSAGHAYRGNCS
jgi:prepilin-type N-terminal cleavage/methylation domain-containing protein